MVSLTGSDFQRINFYYKNLVSSKTSEFFLRVKEENLIIIKLTIKKQNPRLLKLRRNIQSPAVTKLHMQSVCACDLLEYSGNSL